MFAVRAVEEARESVVFPATSKSPDTERFVVEAFVSVLFPVTSKVDERVRVVPVIAPRDESVA